MTPRVIVSIVATVALLAGLVYLNARLDRANEADALAQEVIDLKKSSTEKDEKVKVLEAKMQANRLQAEEFNRKWSNFRVEKNRPVCQLDADVVSLLKSASDWNPR